MPKVKKEYEIINELGPQNWLDIAAGEAIILGQMMHDAELVMRGTKLAEGIQKVRYDNDNFSKIEAEAIGLLKTIDEKKDVQEDTLFLDEICEYDGTSKSLTRWGYDLVLLKGEYQILMYMPEYFGDKPSDEYLKVEKIVRSGYENTPFGEWVRKDETKIYGYQRMDITDYYTNEGKLICHTADFVHECGWKKGMYINYHIENTLQAIDTWMKVRSILGRKR